MHLEFYKYQGTGNDFVVIDDRQNAFDTNDQERIAFLCNRRMGVGADGLMLLRQHSEVDFEMLYFNADGKEGSMCGNGGRCIVDFAHQLGMIKEQTTFMAVDGLHEAKWSDELVALKMIDVAVVEQNDNHAFLDTGSPHYVQFVSDLSKIDVVKEGSAIRYNERFKAEGTNVNFAEIQAGSCTVRTYERGVEAETLACGTGVTAVAIAAHAMQKGLSNPLTINVEGGLLKVSFESSDGVYSNVWLEGPATQVYKGTIEC
ncbi:MAG: diaminopimelate epimerase [Bacteroidetes bacterium]|nr:diaminopimelate epimerase [Bacteroidota bacterium]